MLSVLCLVRVPLIGQHCHAVTKNKGCFDRLQVKQENELSDFATVRHSKPIQGCRLDSQDNRASIPSRVKGVFCSRLALGPGIFFRGLSGWSVKLTAHLHLVPGLIISGDRPLRPHMPSWRTYELIVPCRYFTRGTNPFVAEKITQNYSAKQNQ